MKKLHFTYEMQIEYSIEVTNYNWQVWIFIHMKES
jgi:hypothetical protein